MKETDTGIEIGKDKVKKICDVLRRETLEPALKEGEQIVAESRRQAEEMIEDARKAIVQMRYEAEQEIERQRNVFQSSLYQACKQALEALKQSIEDKLFNQELSRLLLKHMQDPTVISQLLTAVVNAIEKEGIGADLSAYVAAAVPARAINALLMQEILNKLKEKSVLVGPFAGGIEVKLHHENITLDISDAALIELVANYIRKDFRELLFSAATGNI